MAISPFAPGTFKANSATRFLINSRSQFDDLQRQMATGKKSETFGGLGTARITSLSMRAKLSEVQSYQETIVQFTGRAKILDMNLNYLGKISNEVRSTTIQPQYDPNPSGKTSMQRYLRDRFSEAVDMLNYQVNGTYYFSGRTTDVRPVVDPETMLTGDAAGRAGISQMVAERKAADFGVVGSEGRVTRGGAGTTATLTEDGAHPFGFKLTAASSSTPDITAALTAGPPANITFNVATNPAPGAEIRLQLTTPDGFTQDVKLVARTGPTVPAGDGGGFDIGATAADTGLNIRTALAAVMANNASSGLPAASAKVATDAFFAGSNSAPPLRVVGPPATATALAAGTAANTVIWYKGDDTAPSARMTQQAKIDNSVTVGVGAQANEEGIRRLLSNLAAYVGETFNPTVPTDKARFEMISQRIRGDLGRADLQNVDDIQADVAMSMISIKLADERHKVKANFVQTVIADVEDANQEETATKLLALQTKMQASYQTTAIISRLNLTDYLR
jgi:flagellar hook-associated protein 3 FlgL